MRFSQTVPRDASRHPTGSQRDRGEFPFRLSNGVDESRYLTWLRNHSNYMAARGLLDYFRAISVMLRGAFVNLLVGLPYLLLLAVVVAAWHVSLDLSPFYVTIGLAVVVAPLLVLFPTQTFLTKIRRFRRSLETGTASSVKERDALERRAGKVLVVLLGVAAFEALPLLLTPFHEWAAAHSFGLSDLGSAMGVALTAFGFADKILSSLPGALSKIAVSLVLSAIGVIVPVLIVLFVADFLVFSPPPEAGDFWMTAAAWSLPGLIALGLVAGLLSRALSRKDTVIGALALIGSVGAALLAAIPGGAYVDDYAAANQAIEQNHEKRTKAELEKREAELRELTADQAAAPGPHQKTLRDMVKGAARALPREIEVVHDAVRNGKPASGPKPTSVREQLAADLEYLDGAAVSYSVSGLSESVAALRARIAKVGPRADLTELATAVALLRRRIALLGNLFVFEGQHWVKHVLAFPNSDLQLLHGPAPAQELALLDGYHDESHAQLFPICGKHYYNVVFHLLEWGERLEDARRELAAAAVYSSHYPTLFELAHGARETALRAKAMLLLTLALMLAAFCWITVDVNLTSIHGLYRDRLASAFLVGMDTKGDVDIENDLDLGDLCRYEAGSTAPYHLINVALNLQGSRDIGLRDRRSDFFIFSKLFIGGKRTGYCRSETMERVFPQMSLATAMAISAAAASPNMGRATSPALVALMTFLNVRLGIWVPNPGRLARRFERPPEGEVDGKGARGSTFEQVFVEELAELTRRWEQSGTSERRLAPEAIPTPRHGLVGLAFSGGGIRSATVNLGIAQALDGRGVFQHFDYLSTVSGGGYIGSSLSALMRGTRPTTEIAGIASVRDDDEYTVVRVTEQLDPERAQSREYRYAKGAVLAIKDGARVKAGQRLLAVATCGDPHPSSFGEQFQWQVPPRALLWEMAGSLDENKRWVNLTDGGHIENLATIELLRRRCKYIVIGDGEADPEHRFGGLATLIRTARIDLGVRIDIDVGTLRLGEQGRSEGHWAIGRIHYPGEDEAGYLLYLKSSLSGDEDEVIREYRHGHAAFPHESTADQMFDEGQFEAYRSLGQHIAEAALAHLSVSNHDAETSFVTFTTWFETLHAVRYGTDRDEPRAAHGGRAA
jgi:hypothetical protein